MIRNKIYSRNTENPFHSINENYSPLCENEEELLPAQPPAPLLPSSSLIYYALFCPNLLFESRHAYFIHWPHTGLSNDMEIFLYEFYSLKRNPFIRCMYINNLYYTRFLLSLHRSLQSGRHRS